MKKYAVAINLISQNSSGIETTSIRLEVVEAVSIEEAIGKVFMNTSGHSHVGAYRAMEIKDTLTSL